MGDLGPAWEWEFSAGIDVGKSKSLEISIELASWGAFVARSPTDRDVVEQLVRTKRGQCA